MQSADLLIDARWVIPVEPAERVLTEHSVVVRAGRIADVLPRADAHARFEAADCVSLPTHALIPGMVNLHTRAALTLLRGQARGLPRSQWVRDRLRALEARHLAPQFVYDGTLLACAEMLRSGITCFNDLYFYPADAGRAAMDSGMRAALGMIVSDNPSPYASDAEDYIAKGLALRDTLRDQPLLSFCMAPQAMGAVSDKTLARLITLAEELDLPVHVVVHESAEEIERGVQSYGQRPMARLHRLGLIGPNLIAAHAAHLTREEAELLAANGSSIAYCPRSVRGIALGAASACDMRARGILVGLGTDSADSNGRLDMLEEMRTAVVLSRTASADELSAHAALYMATLGGARALRLDHAIGSIANGKFADLVAIDFAVPEMMPCDDPITQIVATAGRENISHVWVAGRMLLGNRTLTRAPKIGLENVAVLWQNRVSMETRA